MTKEQIAAVLYPNRSAGPVAAGPAGNGKKRTSVGGNAKEFKVLTKRHEIVSWLRSQLRERSVERKSFWHAMDRDRTGTICIAEFEAGLRRVGIHTDFDGYNTLFTALDQASSMSIQLKSLVHALYDAESPGPEDTLASPMTRRPSYSKLVQAEQEAAVSAIHRL